MKIIAKIAGLLFAVLLVGLTWAEGTRLIYTNHAFKNEIGSGFVVAFVYTLDEKDQEKTDLPDGTRGNTPRWHAVSRVDSIISRLGSEDGYSDIVSLVRVNLARGDVAILQKKYRITGDAILLFVDGVQVGKNIPVGPDFNLSYLKKTPSWLKFDDFVQQELADRQVAARKKAARDRERRRAYNYYYGPRPYVSFGWGGGYYGPYWGGGWGSPSVGFGFSI